MDRLRAARAFVAALLLLVTPLFTFLQYHHYGYWHAEIAVSVLAFAVVALVVAVIAARWPLWEIPALALLVALSADLQFDLREQWVLTAFPVALVVLSPIRLQAAQVVTLMAATMLGATLLLPGVPVTSGPAALPHGNNDLPLVVHLLLDEHIGLDAVPDVPGRPELEQEAHAFYGTHGFTLFDEAYSEHRTTVHSLSHLMNFLPGRFDTSLHRAGKDGFDWELRENAYLTRVRKVGYAVRVRQTAYLNICPEAADELHCEAYEQTQLGVMQDSGLGMRDRLRVIASVYSEGSELYSRLEQSYGAARKRLRRRGVSLPGWTWERSRFSPLSSMAVADQLRRDLSVARRGDYLMAHLLMPHDPYLYDARCSLQPPTEWLGVADPEARYPAKNTPATRAVRYVRYVQQVRCVYRKLHEIMAAIPPALRQDAIVIIHGDHGSRISERDPTRTRPEAASRSDFVDAYSTLFAVRSPRMQPGVNSHVAPITCILKSLVEGGFHSLKAFETCAADPVVFLIDGGPESNVAESLSVRAGVGQ